MTRLVPDSTPAPAARATVARGDRTNLSAGERRLLRAFVRAVALAEPLQRRLASDFGISLADLWALRALSRLGEAPISRYGRELGLHRSTITNLVDRLEGAGLVERAPIEGDRRITIVRLTARGRGAFEAVSVLRDSPLAHRLLALHPADQAALAELLERVARLPGDGGAEGDPGGAKRLARAASPMSTTAGSRCRTRRSGS